MPLGESPQHPDAADKTRELLIRLQLIAKRNQPFGEIICISCLIVCPETYSAESGRVLGLGIPLLGLLE